MKINIKFQHTKRQQQDEWHTGGHEHNMKKKKENPATMLLNFQWEFPIGTIIQQEYFAQNSYLKPFSNVCECLFGCPHRIIINRRGMF